MVNRLRSNPSLIVLTAAFLILAVNLGNALLLYARHVGAAVSFPYPLEYGEGPVLDQTLRLAAGDNIYRASITVPPFTITNSTPLFLLLQVPFARVFGSAFWYGRAISAVSLVFAAIFLGLTLYQLSKDWLAAAISGLLLFAVPYFWSGSVLDRVDTLALALSWAGLYAIVRWPDRRQGLVLSILLFTAAIYSQQTFMLAALVAALAWLLQTRCTRQAAALLASVAGTSLALFLGINSYTQGGFFFNIVTANANIWNYQQVAGQVIDFSFHFALLGLLALTFLLAERLYIPTRTWPFVLPYYLAAILVTLLIGKAGSSDGYMFELSAALCLTAGATIAWLKNHWIRAAVLVLIALQIGSFTAWTSQQFLPKFQEKIDNRAEIAKLSDMVWQADTPVLLDEYIGLLPLNGKRIYYQPFEFNQFAQERLWDPGPLVQDLSQHKFATLIIYFPKDFDPSQSPWPWNVHESFYANYDVTDTLAYNLVFHPKK